MPTKHLETAIVLLNYNGWKDTISCIESLSFLQSKNHSLIVVDNQSTDESFEKIYAFLSENFIQLDYTAFYCVDFVGENYKKINANSFVCLIRSGKNGGFAYGNNVGIKVAQQISKFDFYWMLNSDTILNSDALEPLVRTHVGNPQAGIVGSVLIYVEPQSVVQAIGGVKFHKYLARGEQIGNGLPLSSIDAFKNKPIEVDYISGASMLVSTKFLDVVGMMAEDYFLYFEELDWSYRAKKSNFKMIVAVDSHVLHKEGGSIGTSSKGSRSMLSEYYLSRNLLLFYKKFLLLLLPIAIARNLLSCLQAAKKREFKRSGVIFRATLKGLF